MLITLSDDVLYLVFSHLDAARDLYALLVANRRLKTVIEADNEGWRVFVRSRFPSLALRSEPSATYPWNHLANSLTWQARAWDKKSLLFQALLPIPPPVNNSNHWRQRRHAEAPFHPVIDARFDLADQEEFVVWGAGESLVARRRRGTPGTSLPNETHWHRVEGKLQGYIAGPHDIKSVSIVDDIYGRKGARGLVVARDNGHLQLLDASEQDFGRKLVDFSPEHSESTRFPEKQTTINCVDVLQGRGLFAAGSKAGVFLYRIPDTDVATTMPSSFLDLAHEAIENVAPSVGGAKWMGDDTLLLGLSGCSNPLRYATLTPTGLAELTAVKNPHLWSQFSLDFSNRKLCCGSLAPVDASSILGGSGSNLLLSAWRDGTVCLSDLRTPSNVDTAYCDNIEPGGEFEALLPFGTSHFVGGGAHGAAVKIFDFRWPRQYYHTAGLPCGPGRPFPNPNQAFLPAPRDPGPGISRCDHVAGNECRWHTLSRDLYHRPNGKFFFSKSLPRADARAGVWSLARASPLSPNFYIGISGGVVEANLGTLTDAGELELDPTFGLAPVSSKNVGAGTMSLRLDASLMEFGDGLLQVENDRNVRMPPMRGTGSWRQSDQGLDQVPEYLRQRHRLDKKYQVARDFGQAGLYIDAEEEHRNGATGLDVPLGGYARNF